LERVRALLPEGSGIVFLPVQAAGASDEHRAYRGTLTLSPQTALRTFIEIGESVQRAGIAKLVIINSHGGNIALIELAARALRGLSSRCCTTWRSSILPGLQRARSANRC